MDKQNHRINLYHLSFRLHRLLRINCHKHLPNYLYNEYWNILRKFHKPQHHKEHEGLNLRSNHRNFEQFWIHNLYLNKFLQYYQKHLLNYHLQCLIYSIHLSKYYNHHWYKLRLSKLIQYSHLKYNSHKYNHIIE